MYYKASNHHRKLRKRVFLWSLVFGLVLLLLLWATSVLTAKQPPGEKNAKAAFNTLLSFEELLQRPRAHQLALSAKVLHDRRTQI
jgi:hypothetical protein